MGCRLRVKRRILGSSRRRKPEVAWIFTFDRCESLLTDYRPPTLTSSAIFPRATDIFYVAKDT